MNSLAIIKVLTVMISFLEFIKVTIVKLVIAISIGSIRTTTIITVNCCFGWLQMSTETSMASCFRMHLWVKQVFIALSYSHC